MVEASMIYNSAPLTMTVAAPANRTCAVLQAAYARASGHRALASADHVGVAPHLIKLNKVVPEFRAQLWASSQEFDDLASQEALRNRSDIMPICKWQRVRSVARAPNKPFTIIIFTNPVFSTNGKLAIVEASFYERGGFGRGVMCVVRKATVWTARCVESWIT